MKPLTLLPLLVLTSEAARLVEEIILRDGDQREREERRFESEVGHEQEVIEVIIKEDVSFRQFVPKFPAKFCSENLCVSVSAKEIIFVIVPEICKQRLSCCRRTVCLRSFVNFFILGCF